MNDPRPMLNTFAEELTRVLDADTFAADRLPVAYRSMLWAVLDRTKGAVSFLNDEERKKAVLK